MNTDDQQPVIFSTAQHPLFDSLCKKIPAEAGKLNTRLFPDGESYLRIDTDVSKRSCIILADLSHPNEKYLPLVFLASTLRELGASRVGLVAPYLSYMRQDRRFIDGEAVTSKIFARQLSQQVDWLVSVDPHLHRYHSLEEIYSIPCRVVQGAPALAQWLEGQDKLLLIGPDAESEQWVSQIALQSGHPFVIGEKQRRGDRDVEVALPRLTQFQGYTATIIDDVISSGQTILSCIASLRLQNFNKISCAAVHGVFADGIDKILLRGGLSKLITANTIPHPSNAVDVTDLLLEPIHECLQIRKEFKS